MENENKRNSYFQRRGGVAGELGIAFRKESWVQLAIGRLERGGIVARVGDARRGRVFCAGGVAGDFGGGGGVGGWRTIMSQNACAYLESLSGG